MPSKLLRKHWIDKHILINIINKIWLFVFSFSYIYCKWYIEVSHSARITFDIIREFLFCKCCFFYTTKFSGNKCKCLHFAPPYWFLTLTHVSLSRAIIYLLSSWIHQLLPYMNTSPIRCDLILPKNTPPLNSAPPCSSSCNLLI